MPRYYFHIRDGELVCDEHGVIFASDEEARREAIRAARDIMAEQVRQGTLSLSDRIEIADDSGKRIMMIPFAEAVRIKSAEASEG